MDPISSLIESFSKFPGIGPRQAKRFVYFLLAKDPAFREDFSLAMIRLGEEITQCVSCFRYFQKIHEKNGNCPICADASRDASKLLVIEKDVDFENIQKMRIWDGMYFILGGSLPVLEKEPTKKIRSKELFYAVQERAKNGTLKEIVLAMSATTEGENTLQYLDTILPPLAEKYELKITALGRGLSSGTELEYSDPDTMKNALTNRR
ncbi:MAG: toprim domain-containing protein [Candidatus Paceibacterota bacterium]|jgi:recombination protein RecR|nr:toprim domain-containing protein [Candidatus Paceibacterota bacterium]